MGVRGFPKTALRMCLYQYVIICTSWVAYMYQSVSPEVYLMSELFLTNVIFGFFLVWITKCALRCRAWMNCSPHILHLCGFYCVCIYGFIQVCINRCRFRPQASVNWYLQMSHLCGFSPVCINKCFVGLPDKMNCFSYLCGFSPICISTYALRCPAVVNCSAQMLHL